MEFIWSETVKNNQPARGKRKEHGLFKGLSHGPCRIVNRGGVQTEASCVSKGPKAMGFWSYHDEIL